MPSTGEYKVGTTHYRRSTAKTLCGRPATRRNTVREFGEVSCMQCCAKIEKAGLKALGVR